MTVVRRKVPAPALTSTAVVELPMAAVKVTSLPLVSKAAVLPAAMTMREDTFLVLPVAQRSVPPSIVMAPVVPRLSVPKAKMPSVRMLPPV